MKKILVLTICLLNTVSARMTKEEITAEVEAYKGVARHAGEIISPMYAQVKEAQKTAIAPLDEVIAPLELERSALQEKVQNLYNQRNHLIEERRVKVRDSGEEYKASLEAALAPLQIELARLRDPIQAQVQELRQARCKVESDHYKTKSDPKWGKWVDGLDSLGVGIKMSNYDRQIAELFSSVDGDLPVHIDEIKRDMESKHDQCLRDEATRFNAGLDLMQSKIQEIQNAITPFDEQILALKKEKSSILREVAQGSSALLQEIQQNIEIESIFNKIEGFTLVKKRKNRKSTHK
jgi:hypothetical protein